MGDFKINVLNCNTDSETLDFVETVYSNSFFSTVNTPTSFTTLSKTLMDNIYYNEVTKNIAPGNITTSLSDYLTQFLFIHNRHSDTATYKVKQIQPIHNINKKVLTN